MMGSTKIRPTQFAISWAMPLMAQSGLQQRNGQFKTITELNWTKQIAEVPSGPLAHTLIHTIMTVPTVKTYFLPVKALIRQVY